MKGIAKVNWVHMCDHAFFDNAGKVCLIGLFGSILTASAPATHPRCCFVVNMGGVPGENVALVLQVAGPAEERSLEDLRIDNMTLGPAGDATSIFLVNNLRLPGFGLYRITVLVNGSPGQAGSFTVGRLPQKNELVQ
ncbi:MAG TPA: hypothetical protein VMW83_14490 [Spirochaetia bacterium]|nr:hypothetical protein [Spirochaetia bacterium]